MQIFINRDGQQFGPFTLDQVNQALATGQLLPTDLAFFEGLQQWTPLTQIQGVVVLGAAPMAAPVPVQPEVAAVNPTMATAPIYEVADAVAAKKKKIIMIAGTSVGVIAVTCVLLFVWPGFLKSPEVEKAKPNPVDTGPPDISALQLPDVSGMADMSYFKEIQPIFDAKCIGCHGVKKKKGKLDLSNDQGFAAGADGNPIYVAKEPGESLIVELIYHPDDPMPPEDEEQLTEEEKKKIVAWIAQGAKFN
jgi:mono/diheme cytochrome c family protein